MLSLSLQSVRRITAHLVQAALVLRKPLQTVPVVVLGTAVETVASQALMGVARMLEKWFLCMKMPKRELGV